MIYEFIRKHFPELLGLVNKKVHKKQIAKQKQAKLDSCSHQKSYLYDDDGGNQYSVHCPTCKKDWVEHL